ncbi:MAG: hypothetical protein HY281_00985 [Nitrospirae bacterium]|nr:hypothetical protein [Nitrospirota bacterium]
MNACWAPVQIVVAAMDVRHEINLPAWAVPLVLAAAEALERHAPPVAEGSATSPSQSELVRSVMDRAEM